MKKKPIILVLLIILSLGSIYFTTFRGMPKVDRQPYQDLGKKIAEETAKLLGNRGRIAIIINREFGSFKIPNLDIEMQELTKGLNEKGITVEALEKVEMQKVGLAQPHPFIAAIETQKDVDAIISLVGFPIPPSRNPASLRDYKAKFIVAAPYEPGLKTLLQEGIIQIAILPRFASPSAASHPQTFNGGFQVFTPKDFANLP